MVCTTPEKSPGCSFSLQPSQVHVPRPPTNVIHSVARFRLRVHTLRFETATWNPTSSSTCDLCEADDDVQDEQQTCNLNQDEQHAIFHCTHPHTVSLRRRFKSLFSEARAQDVCTFFLVNFMSELMDYCCLAWTSHRPYLTTGLSGTVWLKVLPCKSISVM